jgi:site-specific DNA recombinase
MQQAVSILRVSTKRQLNEGDGIENQRQGNNRYLQTKGYRLHKEFVVAETADNKERADFTSVLEYIVTHKREIDVAVFWKVDRISRGGVANYYALKSYLAKHGVRIEFATEQIDASASGELMESVLAAMARFENRVRVDRTIGVAKILTKEGYWCRAAPTGFMNGRDTHGKPILLPHPEKWELVKHGLQKQLTGVYKMTEVVEELRQKGLRTSRGNVLSKQSWLLICRSPLYGGLLCGEWTDHQFIRAKFDGPLTPSQWQQLQQVLDGKKRVAAPPPRQKLHPEFPLRRFLHCPKCLSPVRGYAAKGQHGKRFLYYDCHNPACRFRVPVAQAHTLFVKLLQEVTPTPQLLDLFRRVVLEVWEKELHSLNAESDALQKEVVALRDERRSVVELMKRSCDNSALLAELQKDFERVEKQLTLATMTRNEREIEEYDAEAVVASCTHFLRHANELWQRWPVEAKSQVQRLVLPAGVPFDVLEGNRTPQLSLVYAAFPDPRTPESRMAAPTCRVTNPIIGAMIGWYKVLKALPPV